MFSYDNLGRPIREQKTDDSGNYITDTAYDAFSRVDRITYPSGVVIKHMYDANGYLKEIHRDTETGPLYWKAISFNADGKVTREQAGNGVITDRVFSAETGLLREITSPVQQLRYTWDAVGNLTQRRDLQQLINGQPLTEDFLQDGVNRLTSATVVGQSPATVSYDQLGNILTKNGWTYSYAQNASGQAVNHRVAAVNGVAYTYDGNGNITSGGGRTLEWTSFNLPRRIVKGTAESRFGYGFHREMVTHEVWQNGAPVSRTAYVGDYERIVECAVIKHRVHVAGGIAVITLRAEPGQTATETTRWLHHDHLGSTSAVTNENGVAIERHSFDAWGKRRATDWQPAPTGAALTSQWSLRGFTGHEQLDAVGLVQMKGRVYDPELGRFTSGDPYVQDATVPGMLNRYSYVLNRPLSATDPSGHFVAIIGAAFVALVAGSAGAAAGTAIAGALTWGAVATTIASLVVAGAAAGFAYSFVSTLAAGGSLGQSFRSGLTGALWGGVTAGLAYGVGHVVAPALTGSATGAATEIAAGIGHALVGGALAEAQGGDFWSGLAAAGVGYAGGTAAGAWFKGAAPIAIAARTAISAVAGGTAAELTGGKFANGAMTAAFAHLFSGGAKNLRDLGQGVVDLLVGKNWGKAWLSFFGDWKYAQSSGAYLPVLLADAIDYAMSLTDPNTVRFNGYHEWHAGTNAGHAELLGLLGAPLQILGGLYHELPTDWHSFWDEQNNQGTINHFLDSSMDIVANTFGMVGAYFGMSVNRAVTAGNYIPGPFDGAPATGRATNPYSGNPTKAWGQYRMALS